MRMNPNSQAALMGQQMNYPTRIMGSINGVHAGQEGTGSPGDMAHKPGQTGQLQRTVLQKMTAR